MILKRKINSQKCFVLSVWDNKFQTQSNKSKLYISTTFSLKDEFEALNDVLKEFKFLEPTLSLYVYKF